jgi:O-antigen ligase
MNVLRSGPSSNLALEQQWSWKVCGAILALATITAILVVYFPLAWVGVLAVLAVGAQFFKPISGLAVVMLSCGLLSYSPFEAGALSRLYPGDIAIGIFLVTWFVNKASWPPRDLFQPNVINRPLLGIAIVTVLSMIWSRLHPDPSVTYSFPHSDVSWTTTQVSQVFLLAATTCMPFAVASAIKNWKDVETVVITMGIVVALGSAVTIAALTFGFGGSYSILGAVRAYWQQPWSSSMEPLASLVLPFLYAGFLFGRRSISRYWLIRPLFVFCLVGVGLTFSRESWLLAFLGVLFVSALWIRRNIKSVVSLLVVSLVLFGVLFSGVIGVVSRFYNPDEVYGFERIYFYITALQLFITHPLLGVGAGNYQFFDRIYAEVSAGGVAHNQLLEVAAEMGLPGLIIFCWLVWALLRFLRTFRLGVEGEDGPPYWLRAAAWAFAFVWIAECLFRDAFLVTAAGGGGTKSITDTIFAWILLGVLFATSNLSRSSVDSKALEDNCPS